MQIALEHPDQPEVVALIDELDAFQKPLYPPECHYGIDMAALSKANVLFAVARGRAQRAQGCGAIVLGPELGELKRMYVRPAHRGQGVARRLLDFLEQCAMERGCRAFGLETGVYQPQALALYTAAGYQRCGPFGGYPDDPLSVFMHKQV
jgi:putative acetyltransferase